MKRLVALGVFLASATVFVPVVLAYSSPGSPTGYVHDFAQVLRSDTRQALERELVAFNQTTSNEITVVTVQNMGGEYIENYAVKLFEEWKIGKKTKDNGVLLLLSIEERKIRIEVGYGLEGALPDSIAQRILDNEMTPRLKSGDYDGAVTAGTRAIEEATKGEYVGMNQPSNFLSEMPPLAILASLFFAISVLQIIASMFARSRSWWAGGVVGFLGGGIVGLILSLSLMILLPLILGLTIFGLFLDYFVSSGYKNAKANGVTPPWWAGGSGGRGGSSGSGGFGGFGGGSSGGGGASGRW